jgi:acyl-coenzyme A thioesterase PaaI-like protein
VERGKTMGFVECDITDDQKSLVARASSTCMTLRGEQALGR